MHKNEIFSKNFLNHQMGLGVSLLPLGSEQPRRGVDMWVSMIAA